jgi:two-component sensor histidine kinase
MQLLGQRTMHILIIDDNANDRLLVRREILRDHGNAEIEEVASPQQLDRALVVDRINLAVIDYSLGWAEGLAIFRKVRAVDPDCAAIMYTGTLGEEHAVEAIKAGLDDYIVKDIARLPRLRASIHALLAQQKQRRALRRAEARYRDLFRKVTVGLFACAPDGTFEDGNPALLAILGLNSVEALRNLNLMNLLTCDEVRQCWHALPPARMAKLETSLTRPDAATRWVLVDAYPSIDAGGTIEGVLTDVTALKTALDQKTMLLKEAFHRVHNNLQLVQTLLFLQEQRSKDLEIREGFREISSRIRSLSLIQQKLYQRDDLKFVDFADYLRDLTDALLRIHRRPEITASFDVEPLLLSIDKATPLGLVANELLTNALKHAFPAGRAGEIRVKLRRATDGQSALTIADNGIGTEMIAFPSSNGLGSQLIQLLATQLQAQVELDRSGGFTTTVRFKS